MRLYSWNVNGLRAVLGKGFLKWVRREKPDVLCLQETKLQPDQLPDELARLRSYKTWLAAGERKGYAGVGLMSRSEPMSVSRELGEYKFDREGRIIEADYEDFVLLTTYFPNGRMSKERLAYKLEFYDWYLDHLIDLKGAGRSVVVCGDFNTAHQERDLTHPKANAKTSGFLPEERAWMDKFIAAGYVDTFRLFTSEGGHYTWWSYRFRARDKDIGWRIDYHCVDQDFADRVKSSTILKQVMGSDHCPVQLTLK